MLIHSGCKDTRAVVEPDLWVKNRKTGLRSNRYLMIDEKLQWLQFQPISPASTSSCGVSLSLTEVILGFDRVTGGRSSISAGPKWIGLVPWQRLARSDMKSTLLQLMWNRWQVQLQLATTKILIVVIEMWDKKVASNSDIKWAQNWAASHVLSSSWEDLVLQQPLTGRLGEQVLLLSVFRRDGQSL